MWVISNRSYTNIRFTSLYDVQLYMGVTGGPSGPSQEGPGIGHKIVSDTKQMTKERKKKWGRRKNV